MSADEHFEAIAQHHNKLIDHLHGEELLVRHHIQRLILTKAQEFLQKDHTNQDFQDKRHTPPTIYPSNTIMANAPAWVRFVNGFMERLGQVEHLDGDYYHTPTPLFFDSHAVHDHLRDAFDGGNNVKITFSYHGSPSVADLNNILVNNLDPKLRKRQSFGVGAYTSMRYEVAHEFSKKKHPVLLMMLIKVDRIKADYCYVTNCPTNYNANYLFPIGYINLCSRARGAHRFNASSFVLQQHMTPKQSHLYIDHCREKWCAQNKVAHVPRHVLDQGSAAVVIWLKQNANSHDARADSSVVTLLQALVIAPFPALSPQFKVSPDNTPLNITWQWQEDSNWIDYSSADMDCINEHYKKCQSGEGRTFTFTSTNTKPTPHKTSAAPVVNVYRIDFDDMTQTNTRTNFTRRIRSIVE